MILTRDDYLNITGGNVGINSPAPDYTLTIDGNFNASYNSGTLASLTRMSSIEPGEGGSLISIGLKSVVTDTDPDRTVYGIIGIANSSNDDGPTRSVGIYGESEEPFGSEGAETDGYAGYFNGHVGYLGDIGNPSDEILKENITDLTSSLSMILSLKPKSFTYKRIPRLNFPRTKRSGFLAGEFFEVFPELVMHKSPTIPIGRDGASTINKLPEFSLINYVGLIPHLVQAIQEQQEIIEEIQKPQAPSNADDQLPTETQRLNGIPHIINYFPNPTRSDIQVESFTNGKNGTLTLYKKDGQIINSTVIDDEIETISLSDLVDGIYLLALSVSNVTYDVKRIVVSK